MRVLYITTTLPSLTVTFIHREITELLGMGFKIDKVSMNTPDRSEVSEETKSFLQDTLYLDQVALSRKILSAIWALVMRPRGSFLCLKSIIKELPMRWSFFIRLIYHFVEACDISRRLSSNRPDHVHCHFVSGPTSLGMFVALLCELPFSFTMHGSNVWLYPVAIREKLRLCCFCVAVSEHIRQHVLNEYGNEFAQKIKTVYCGVPIPSRQLIRRRGSAQGPMVHVLAVGQMVKRKGFDILVEACSLLKYRSPSFRCTIVGGGALYYTVYDQVTKLGLRDIISLPGAMPYEAVRWYYSRADVFVCPSVIADDGTREGIPVVLMEAMSWRVPVVASASVGIPELVVSGQDGLLFKEGDSRQLAQCMQLLIESRRLRTRLGQRGLRKVIEKFDIRRSASQLSELFQSTASLGSRRI